MTSRYKQRIDFLLFFGNYAFFVVSLRVNIYLAIGFLICAIISPILFNYIVKDD